MRHPAAIALGGFLAVGLILGRADWLTVRDIILGMDARYCDECLWNRIHPAVPPTPNYLPPPRQRDWIKDDPIIIAHALAPIDGISINSRLALGQVVARGFEVVEVDLSLTRDGHVICFHEDDRNVPPPELSTAAVATLPNGAQPCTLADLISLARQIPRLRFIIDVKSRFNETYGRIQAEIADPDIGKQFIPQVYDFADIPTFRKAHFFAEPFFTSYRSPLSNREILHTARVFDVDVVAMPVDRVKRIDHLPSDIRILVHPVDSLPLAKYLICQRKVYGIYTFSLTPSRHWRQRWC